MMKKTYQKPVMLAVNLRVAHIVCASKTDGNTGIHTTDADDSGQVIRSRQHSVWDNGEDE